MSGILDKDIQDALGSLTSNLQLVIDQLKDGENMRGEDPNFDAMQFWARFELTFKAVSTESTKLTMAFSTLPCPNAQGAETLITSLEKSTLAMLSAFYSLPITQGQMLHKKTFSTVYTILTSVQGLANVIKTQGVEGSKRQLQSAGGVWEYCDSFPNLPKNNRDAVYLSARENNELVKDALEEIEAAIDEDEDDDEQGVVDTGDDRWTQNDRKVLSPALGLLKAARTCLKKTTTAVKENGQFTDQAHINQLDNIGDIMTRVSPAVDDFVLSLYPPIRTAKEESQNLADILHSLLDQVRSCHVTSNADSKWIDFLTKAVSHNHDKVRQLLPQ